MNRCRFARFTGIFLALLAAAQLCVPAAAMADQSGDFTYTVTNKTVEITAYKGKGGEVSVPEKIAGSPVISIAAGAFKDCETLTKLTLPRGVREIGNAAFSGCKGLKSVSLPSDLAFVGDYAFKDCAALAQFTLPDSVYSLGRGAFDGCKALAALNAGAANAYYSSVSGVLYDRDMEILIRCPAGKTGSLSVPEGVVSIADEALSGCGELMYVSLPKSLASIGSRAFSGCSSLSAIVLPENLETIGTSAFDGCAKLKSITIPSGVIDAGRRMFEGCTALASILVGSGNETYKSVDGVLYDRSGVELIRCPEGRKGLFSIPDGVGLVSDWAFSGCAGLTGISVPASVFHIGEGAFVCGPAWAMSGSGEKTAASGLKSIAVDAQNPVYQSLCGVLFDKAAGRLIAVPAGLTGSFSIPQGVHTVGAYALACCTALTVVTLPDTVTGIGESAFSYCAGIQTVTIPAGVSYIGAEAFYGCTRLSSVYTAAAPSGLGADAFGGTAKDFKVFYHASVSGQWADFNTYAKQAYCTVTTDLADGSAATRSIVEITGGKLTAPAQPKRTGFAFAGWYKDAGAETVWDFQKDEVISDVTLYAKWVTAAPASLRAASTSYQSVTLRWGGVQGVTGYEITRAASASGSYTLLATTAGTSWTNTGLATGRTYYYRIRAYRLNGAVNEYGAYSSVAAAKTVPGTPKPKAAVSAGSVALKWASVSGAQGYEVWRCATSASGAYELIAAVKPPACSDAAVTAGSPYWYKVRAYRMVSGKKVYGLYSGAVGAKP